MNNHYKLELIPVLDEAMPEATQVRFQVGVQLFFIGCPMENKEQGQWFANNFAKAVDQVVFLEKKEQSELYLKNIELMIKALEETNELLDPFEPSHKIQLAKNLKIKADLYNQSIQLMKQAEVAG